MKRLVKKLMKKLFSIRLVMVPAVLAVLGGGLGGCEATPRRPGVDLGGGTIAGPGVPGQAEVLRAEALQRRGDREAALAIFERAIQRNPELTVAYLGAGDIYRETGDYSNAERRYAKAAELEPRNFDAQYFHGLSLQLLDRFAEAVRAYLRALSIRPGDFDANLNLATAYLQLGEPRQAQVYALRAVRLNGQSGSARANLGAVYAALEEHEAAVAEFQQAAELMELNPQLLLNLADSLSRVGRHAESINTLDQVLRLEPSPEAFERLGAARFRMRSYDDAAAAFEQAIALDTDHYPAINGLAVCRLNDYLWSDREDTAAYNDAVELLRRSLRIRPNQPKIIELLRRYG